jgi:hypothetical protein
MQIALQPAIPAVLPRFGAAKAAQDRLCRQLANAVTVLSAAVAIIVVALSAVVIGIT